MTVFYTFCKIQTLRTALETIAAEDHAARAVLSG
jgi:hypothetical protein